VNPDDRSQLPETGYSPFSGARALPPEALWAPPPPRPKFRHNYRRHLIFFLLTFFTTTFAPSFAFMWMAIGTGINPFAAFSWAAFTSGLWYSLPLLTILSAHEFGHYFACRRHDVDATLPYFIPAPLPLTGTLGAVIRIKEAFPSKRALFDIGVAGPIAGFVVLVPFLIWGILKSDVGPMPDNGAVLYFGEPLLWKALEILFFGVLPEGTDVMLHPMGFAAWWGMLATALNLLPFGQLDGGHIMYAAVGRRAAWLSAVTLVLVVVLTMRSTSWMAMALMMTAMAMLFGFRHPRVIDEHSPLDAKRRVVAVMALVIFIVCFTPVPIDITGMD
jgi:membrane-associated protease RseP (regulator of RpoE activity)